MKITPALFRTILLLSFVFNIIALVVDLAFPSLIPEPLLQAQEVVEMPDFSLRDLILFVTLFPLLIAGFVSIVSLYLFQPWAPKFSLFSTILLLLAYPSLEYYLYSGWSATLADASSMLWGAVLALTFYSPIRKKFRRM